MGSVIQVPGVDVREQGDIRLKLCTECPPEKFIQGEVQWGEIHQRREPVGRNIPLHILDIFWPLLILDSRDEKEGMKEGNKSVPANR